MTDHSDRDPDRAVLDELSRAFDEPTGRHGVQVDPDSGVAASGVGIAASGEAASGQRPVVRISDDILGDGAEATAFDDVRGDDARIDGLVSGPVTVDRDRRPTVVIVEDEALDGSAVDAVSGGRSLGRRRRGVEPRLRQRRIAVRRLIARRRLYWSLVAVTVAISTIGALAVLGSPLFAVRADRVVVTGAVYTDADRLGEILDDLVGTPVLRVDTRRIEQELEAIPWVDRARVRVDFPRGATVEIRERGALTTYQGPDGRFRVLDRSGRVLDVIDGYPFAYILLVGPDPVDLEPAMFAPVGYAAASELAKNLTPAVRGRVDRIVVRSDGSQLVMVLDDGSEVFFGEARDFFAKLLRLETVLGSSPDREPGPIDVSTADVTS